MMVTVQNPVVRGHAPDPSVIRVGEDYFLATSSFRFLPGIPIRHSRDLVHWRTVGFAVARPDQYRRDGQPGDVNLFAPTLRHHDGRFYLICTNEADGQGNFYVTASDPAGPWSEAIWVDRDAFDPSLFRDDDGQWYYTRRTLQFGAPDRALGPIVQATIDIETGALGELAPITADRRGFVSNDIEGPHLYRIGEWYYLFAAEGSSWKGHMQTLGRGRSPWGPFEPAPHNPVLTHRDFVTHPFQTIGHAELVDDGRGHWWALTLGTRHPMFASHHTLGRETFLVPVTWQDGWPVIGDAGHVPVQYDDPDLPLVEVPDPAPELSWAGGWRTLGDPSRFPVADGDAVVLDAGADLTDPEPRGTLLLPQDEYEQTFSASVLPAEGTRAGVAVWANSTHHYSALVEQVDGVTTILFRRVVDDLVTEERVRLSTQEKALKLTVSASSDSYRFTASDGETVVEVGGGLARLLSAEAIQWFTNVSFALVAVATSEEAVPVRFEDVRRVDTAPNAPRPFGIPR